MLPIPSVLLIIITLLTLILVPSAQARPRSSSSSTSHSTHTNNHAILISTSRNFFNYRHATNTLSLYHKLKENGIPDSNIVLMLADDLPCNTRNVFPGKMFTERNYNVNLYPALTDMEVDYKGTEVTVSSFTRLLTGRHLPGTPNSKKLHTNSESNLLIYMTGHGGDGFLKFQDSEEINSFDFNSAFIEMYSKHRYKNILLIVDTCQAGTLSYNIKVPNLTYIGSSLINENSYAHSTDSIVGVAVIDRFTRGLLEFLNSPKLYNEHSKIGQMVKRFDPVQLKAHIAVETFGSSVGIDGMFMVDFFSNFGGSGDGSESGVFGFVDFGGYDDFGNGNDNDDEDYDKDESEEWQYNQINNENRSREETSHGNNTSVIDQLIITQGMLTLLAVAISTSVWWHLQYPSNVNVNANKKSHGKKKKKSHVETETDEDKLMKEFDRIDDEKKKNGNGNGNELKHKMK